MNNVLAIYKKKGETPLEALDRLREEQKAFQNVKLSYAGRLDPMAEGVMLVLIGEANRHRTKHLSLPKVYQTDILFGIKTDTGDVLGLIQKIDPVNISEIEILKEKIITNLSFYKGEFEQAYPNYSSKTFEGVALFQHARDGREVPKVTHMVFVKDIKILGFKTINQIDFIEKVKEEVPVVKGDFRQTEILAKYDEVFKNFKDSVTFLVLSLEMSVSSGFYVRQFAEDLGGGVDLPALALNIKRIKVGDFEI